MTDTKTAILDCGERLSRTRGFDGFSYADIASEIGIRKASIHHHFPTKAALALALIKRYSDRVLASCEAIDDTYRDGKLRLKAFVNLYRDASSKGDCLCLCVAFGLAPESLDEAVKASVRLYRANVRLWIETALEQESVEQSNDDLNMTAASILALLEGAQLSARTEQSVDGFNAAVQMFERRLA